MSTIEGQETILSRLERLDNMMGELEEMRGYCNGNKSGRKRSCSSTPSSGTVTSLDTGGHVSSSLDFSPESFEKHCRPIEHVIMESEIKGTVMERLNQVEDRLLKLAKELQEFERIEEKSEKKTKNGFRQLLKKLVRRSRKHKSKTNKH